MDVFKIIGIEEMANGDISQGLMNWTIGQMNEDEERRRKEEQEKKKDED